MGPLLGLLTPEETTELRERWDALLAQERRVSERLTWCAENAAHPDYATGCERLQASERKLVAMRMEFAEWLGCTDFDLAMHAAEVLEAQPHA